MFGFPRCGSTYLCSLLDSHPKILCHYEVFHPEEIVTVSGFKQAVEDLHGYTLEKRDENPQELIDILYGNGMGAEAVGFKIFIGHSEKAHDLLIEDRGIKKILLRRDSIPAYVSMLIAESTGAFTHKEQTSAEQQKVSLDMGGLLNFHRILEQYFDDLKRRIEESGQQYLEVFYEQLVSDPAVLDGVFDYIGIDKGANAVKAFTKKQNKAGLAEKIDNVNEVVAESMELYFGQERLIKRYDADIDNLQKIIWERDAGIAQITENVATLQRTIRERDAEIARLTRLLEDSHGKICSMLASVSWRVTAPLRWLVDRFPNNDEKRNR